MSRDTGIQMKVTRGERDIIFVARDRLGFDSLAEMFLTTMINYIETNGGKEMTQITSEQMRLLRELQDILKHDSLADLVLDAMDGYTKDKMGKSVDELLEDQSNGGEFLKKVRFVRESLDGYDIEPVEISREEVMEILDAE